MAVDADLLSTASIDRFFAALADARRRHVHLPAPSAAGGVEYDGGTVTRRPLPGRLESIAATTADVDREVNAE